MSVEREHLKSRLGFILLSAGCAIGIGNVWKFPYMVGENGGAFFVLIYMFFLVLIGVPVMTMEFALGRASQKSPAHLYQQLEKKGQKWHIHGKLCVVGNYLLMMFYTTVAGWMLQYFLSMAAGKFSGMSSEQVADSFDGMLSDPLTMIIYMAVIVLIGFGVCSLGLQNGLERITKVMMTVLIVIMMVLAVNSIFLDGGSEGMRFYLMPDIEAVKEIGLLNVIVAAMSQAFFTLSVGIGSMAIFGSYIGKDRALMGEAVNVALLDTLVAVASGLIIFPACFAYDVEVSSGPSLVFITLPNIFNNIPLGRLWGSLFFVFMTFAALSTVLAVFENILSCTMDLFGWSRKKSCLINGAAIILLSLPCILGFNVLSGFMPFGEGTNIMDLEDFAVSNLFLPLGSLCYVVFCVSRYGWGWDKFIEEANTGKGLKIAKWMRPYMTYVLPVMVAVLFVMGIVSKL